MLINKLTERLNRYYFFWAFAVIGVLLILGLFLRIQIEVVKRANLRNQIALKEGFPGFNKQSLQQLKQEIRNSKIKIARLAGIFDPKEKWLKNDYDLSIYFVEQVGEINRFLKAKSVEKQISIPELAFKEKMPAESEAFYLLSQLYGLQEIINLGIDYNIQFQSINPLEIQKLDGLPEIRLAGSRIEFICPAEGLIEFILQLSQLIPRPSIESLSLQSQEDNFQMVLTLNNILVNLDWKDKQEFYAYVQDSKEGLEPQEQNWDRVLRGSNLFFVPAQKEMSSSDQAQAASKTKKPKQEARFLYRGKATLKSKEVVVIEDTLNQETLFLAPGDSVGNFTLDSFSTDQALLKNADNGQEIIIKREEE